MAPKIEITEADKKMADEVRGRIIRPLNDIVAAVNYANENGLSVTFNIGGPAGKQALEYLRITKPVEL